jgi:hypothetical protein
MHLDTKDKMNTAKEERLFSGVLWPNTEILGLSLELLCGLVIFSATN